MSSSSEHEETDIDFYKSLVLGFRMTQLQELLVFAGKSRSGRKNYLQDQALRLVDLNSKTIFLKVRELASDKYRSHSDNMDNRGATTSRTESSYSNPYTSPIPDSPPRSPSVHQLLPTFPDVELKPLPFYEIKSTLLKPCSLKPSGNARFQDQTFKFHLTPAQATEITGSSYRNENGRPEYRKQIQMRFSLLETSCQQEDNFPQSISVKVNQRLCPLPPFINPNKPGVDSKRLPRPMNITSLCKLSATSANMISVSWAVEVGKSYTISVYFVENLNYQDLLGRLKEKGERNPDFTKALIKEKLADQDQEIATTSCKVSLACPLGKMRMRIPCRPSTCDHLQTFDAGLFLQMNEKKPKWVCPVCNKPALNQNLMIDGFFTELLKSDRLPPDEHEIVLHNDGTWDPLPPKKEECASVAAASAQAADFVPIDDTDSDNSTGVPNAEFDGGAVRPTAAAIKRPSDSLECITLDDSDDEDTSKRPKNDYNPGSPDLIILD